MKKSIITIMLSMLCVATGAQHKIVFTPQWTPQAQFAGYYVAEAMGFYRDAGLDVSIVHPSASNPCINRMKKGSCQIITLQLPTALHHINNGMHLINVLQVLQNNSQMIVSRRPLKNIYDLQGKRVATWHSGFNELAFVMARQYKVEVEWVEFLQNVNLFVSGAVDATMAQSYNEFFQLMLAGQRFQRSQLIYLADIGFNIPEDGIYVSADYYKENRKQVDKFVAASRRGWEWAAVHPQETLNIVIDMMQRNRVKTSRPAQRYMLEQILKLMVDRKTGKRTFRLEPEALQLANQLMMSGGYQKYEVTYQQITEP